MKNLEVVAAIIRSEDNKVFIAQRSFKKKQGGKWEFVGGKVEDGESYEDALKRELLEEFKVLVKVKDHFLTVNHDYIDFKINLHAYDVEILDGTLTPTEHEKVKWVALTELKNFDFLGADVPIVEKLDGRYTGRI